MTERDWTMLLIGLIIGCCGMAFLVMTFGTSKCPGILS